MDITAQLSDAISDLPDWAEPWARAIVYGLAAYLVARLVRAVVRRALHGSPHVEDTLEKFTLQVFSAATAIFVVVAFLVGLGIDPVALAGGVAIGGFIIGFAVKDALGNLAAGVVLLINRPFRVGEAVQLKGHGGVVEELGVAITRLRTWDGVMVAIPNGTIITEAIVNYSRNATRRVDLNLGIDHADDVDAAMRGIMRTLKDDERVLENPAPQVVIMGIGENAVDLEVRAWVPNPKWGDAKSDLTKKVKDAVEGAGCRIPKREVTLVERKAE